MLGLRYGTVRLEPYDPEWANAFVEERSRLLEGLSGISCQVQHIGSTAVPGLCAKPILDIAVGVAVGTLIEPVVSALRGIGYQYRGDARDCAGHIFVREAAEQVRTHHVHVVDLDGPQWRAYLRLREALRTSRAARQIYSSQKTLLANRYPGDRKEYTAAKERVIQELLARAEGVGRTSTDGVVTLGRFAPEDASALRDGDYDSDHRRRFEVPDTFVPSIEHSLEVIAQWAQDWTSGTRLTFAVRDSATGTLLGGCELQPRAGGVANLSYWTYAPHRRRRVASRAVALVCELAFAQFGLQQVEILTDPDNQSSKCVALCNGFKESGIRDGRVLHLLHANELRSDGQRCDTY